MPRTKQWKKVSDTEFVHHSEKYRLRLYVEARYGTSFGQWTLLKNVLTFRLEENKREIISTALGRYPFYGQVKRAPPTTWANRLIRIDEEEYRRQLKADEQEATVFYGEA